MRRKLFGEIAVELGIVTYQQVLEALERKRELEKERGRRVLIGAVLMERGHLKWADESMIMQMQARGDCGGCGQ